MRNKSIDTHFPSKLAQIAEAHGVAARDIFEFNRVSASFGLSPGWVLMIPGSTTSNLLAPSDHGVFYTMKQGDTFYSLAKGCEVTVVDAFVMANPAADPAKLLAGSPIVLQHGAKRIYSGSRTSRASTRRPPPENSGVSNKGLVSYVLLPIP